MGNLLYLALAVGLDEASRERLAEIYVSHLSAQQFPSQREGPGVGWPF